MATEQQIEDVVRILMRLWNIQDERDITRELRKLVTALATGNEYNAGQAANNLAYLLRANTAASLNLTQPISQIRQTILDRARREVTRQLGNNGGGAPGGDDGGDDDVPPPPPPSDDPLDFLRDSWQPDDQAGTPPPPPPLSEIDEGDDDATIPPPPPPPSQEELLKDIAAALMAKDYDEVRRLLRLAVNFARAAAQPGEAITAGRLLQLAGEEFDVDISGFLRNEAAARRESAARREAGANSRNNDVDEEGEDLDPWQNAEFQQLIRRLEEAREKNDPLAEAAALGSALELARQVTGNPALTMDALEASIAAEIDLGGDAVFDDQLSDDNEQDGDEKKDDFEYDGAGDGGQSPDKLWTNPAFVRLATRIVEAHATSNIAERDDLLRQALSVTLQFTSVGDLSSEQLLNYILNRWKKKPRKEASAGSRFKGPRGGPGGPGGPAGPGGSGGPGGGGGPGNGGPSDGGPGDGSSGPARGGEPVDIRKELGKLAALQDSRNGKLIVQAATLLHARLQREGGKNAKYSVGDLVKLSVQLHFAQSQGLKKRGETGQSGNADLSPGLVNKVDWEHFCGLYDVDVEEIPELKRMSMKLVKSGEKAAQTMAAGLLKRRKEANKKPRFNLKNAAHLVSGLFDALDRKAKKKKVIKPVRSSTETEETDENA
ncbi:hypothetical protein [Roseibium litorale]|uniref:Uncharacterized protein n=1 Tax=Roseibium litorale TaxID=2803841 RepID=A0ABR9CQ89_9HYPH|nr:hypothetical protein [Roseibium litorale]MBD8893031.1 hypothetical protein [Roseibium litorale]